MRRAQYLGNYHSIFISYKIYQFIYKYAVMYVWHICTFLPNRRMKENDIMFKRDFYNIHEIDIISDLMNIIKTTFGQYMAKSHMYNAIYTFHLAILTELWYFAYFI